MTKSPKFITTFLPVILVFAAGICKAQDIIVKSDNSEIKSKVIEISDSAIKYKKWENQEGPLYSISKADVLLIIYKNGQREVIRNKPLEVTEKIMQEKTPAKTVIHTASTDTVIKTKADKVNYKPFRVMLGSQEPLSLGIDWEFRLVKNFVNLGGTAIYYFPEDKTIRNMGFGFLYAGVYAPVNRLMKKYNKQDVGFFPYLHLGYGGITATIVDPYTNFKEQVNSNAFTWRFGTDFFVTDNFGIHISTFEFSTFYAGVSLKF